MSKTKHRKAALRLSTVVLLAIASPVLISVGLLAVLFLVLAFPGWNRQIIKA